jgi:hypothetical protein
MILIIEYKKLCASNCGLRPLHFLKIQYFGTEQI